MSLARYFYAMLLCPISLPAGAGDARLPSDPGTWNGDFLKLVQPSAECPGGTIEQLGKRAVLSQSYSPPEFEAFHRGALSIQGLGDSDRFYSFYSRTELPIESFWAFGGYVVVRDACIIHAEVTTYDN